MCQNEFDSAENRLKKSKTQAIYEAEISQQLEKP